MIRVQNHQNLQSLTRLQPENHLKCQIILILGIGTFCVKVYAIFFCTKQVIIVRLVITFSQNYQNADFLTSTGHNFYNITYRTKTIRGVKFEPWVLQSHLPVIKKKITGPIRLLHPYRYGTVLYRTFSLHVRQKQESLERKKRVMGLHWDCVGFFQYLTGTGKSNQQQLLHIRTVRMYVIMFDERIICVIHVHNVLFSFQRYKFPYGTVPYRYFPILCSSNEPIL